MDPLEWVESRFGVLDMLNGLGESTVVNGELLEGNGAGGGSPGAGREMSLTLVATELVSWVSRFSASTKSDTTDATGF